MRAHAHEHLRLKHGVTLLQLTLVVWAYALHARGQALAQGPTQPCSTASLLCAGTCPVHSLRWSDSCIMARALASAAACTRPHPQQLLLRPDAAALRPIRTQRWLRYKQAGSRLAYIASMRASEWRPRVAP